MKKYIVKCCLMTLAGFQLAGLPSCSNADNELETVVNGETTRVTLVEKKIEDLEAGTLSTRLTDEEKASVQRLVLAGTFNAADVDCLRNELSALIELDMENVQIVASEFTYSGYRTLEANQIGDSMFENMSKLERIKIPSTIEVICSNAFRNSNVADLEIPASVKEIGSYAFSDCKNLTKITIPATVTRGVGNGFTISCTNLESVEFLAETVERKVPNDAFRGCNNLKTIKLAASITSLGIHSFYGCSSLSDFSAFVNINNIEEGAFRECGFETVDLSNVLTFGPTIFAQCRALRSVVLPEDMTSIPSSMFWECTSLENITLPSKLKEIGFTAFAGSHLKEIEFPVGLTTIGSDAFSSTLLTDIKIPSTVTTIGTGVFNSTLLRELEIPESVTSIGGNFVASCKYLTSIYWNTSVTPVPYCYDINPNCLLFIDYKTTPVAADPSWKNIITNGKASVIYLSKSDYSYAFSSPREFEVEKIYYTYNFSNSNYTSVGQSSNWNTLTLPFAPSAITHESKGTMAPFGSDVEGAKPFWLRKLGTEGFENATTIEANVPYIIAVPNNPNIYLDEYNLAGKVTFSAENVTMSVTPTEPVVLVGPNYSMYSNYEYKPADVTVYALNTDYYVDGYNYGSVFVRGVLPVFPFQAYVKNNSAASRVIPISTKAVGSRTKTAVNTTGIPCVDDM